MGRVGLAPEVCNGHRTMVTGSYPYIYGYGGEGVKNAALLSTLGAQGATVIQNPSNAPQTLLLSGLPRQSYVPAGAAGTPWLDGHTALAAIANAVLYGAGCSLTRSD